MARVVKNEEPWHVITFECDDGRFVMSGPGSHPRLYAWKDGWSVAITIEGRDALRALARAILRTVPAPKKRNTKRRK